MLHQKGLTEGCQKAVARTPVLQRAEINQTAACVTHDKIRQTLSALRIFVQQPQRMHTALAFIGVSFSTLGIIVAVIIGLVLYFSLRKK